MRLLETFVKYLIWPLNVASLPCVGLKRPLRGSWSQIAPVSYINAINVGWRSIGHHSYLGAYNMFCYIRFLNVFTTFTLLAASNLAIASDDRYDASSVGFALSSGNGDFSTGVAVTSPWFLGSSVAVQAAAMQSWYIHGVDESSGEESWMPYSSYKLGVMGGSVTSNGFMRMYGVGGLLYIAPNKKISDKTSVLGSYGAFGFEFFSGRNLNYYIELGANGISAHADKLPGKPIYSNGFSTTVGLRYYL